MEVTDYCLITFVWDIDGYADQTMRVVLDNETYEMRLQWNERDESWWLSLGALGDDPLVCRKVCNCQDILDGLHYRDDLPKGRLMVLSFKDEQYWGRVGRYNLGARSELQLVYGTPIDVYIETRGIE
jgi:hypothetical protein